MRSGSQISSSKILFIGEAYGETEEKLRLPFQGASGSELRRMIASSGISPSDCSFTNVVNLRPPSNNFELLCEKGRSSIEPPFNSPLTKGLYLKPEYHDQVRGLYADLKELSPTLVVPLGNTALWALSQQSPKISSVRGTLFRSPLGYKCLPTFHPAAILRAWDLHPVLLADLMKVRYEAETPEITRPNRKVYIEPTLSDLAEWFERIRVAPRISIDTETKRFGPSYQITCVGFAISPQEAFVLPFVRGEKSYWPDLESEFQAWNFVREVCALPILKIFQNYFFDLYVLWKVVRIPVLSPVRDTMISHHALFPELEKSLAFQGSIYTKEPAWKLERPRGFKTDKGEEE